MDTQAGLDRCLVHVQPGAALDEPVHLAPPCPWTAGHVARRSLIMQSLGCVLAATVRGARGSRVPLIIGLSCTRRSRRRRATEPHFHAPEWAARPMTTDKDEVGRSIPSTTAGLLAGAE